MKCSSSNETKRLYSNKKYRRLPNGFGQISKIKGNLRNPFRAMVTVGKTETGRPICKLLKPKAYFKTYNEAYQALMKYHDDPFDLCCDMTCQELFDRWSEEHFKTIGRARNTYIIAWRYCSEVYDLPIQMLRSKHIKSCMLNGHVVTKKGDLRYASPNVQANIKTLWNMMLDWALERELVPRNYSRDMPMPKIVEETRKANYVGHQALSEDDVRMLYENIADIYHEMAYVQCYMGWRPGEIVGLRTENIDLENMAIKGGSKTEAGRDRIVPIHPAIREIIQNRYDPNNEFLYGVKYWSYKYKFDKMLPNHAPHDCRKTFITMAKKAGVDEYTIKRIVGHRISDITEDIYTERDLGWLADEISKIPTVGNM